MREQVVCEHVIVKIEGTNILEDFTAKVTKL